MLWLACVALSTPTFAAPHPWALGFAPSGRIPMVSDLNGDGFADLVCVSPKGDAFIDIALNNLGQKSLVPRRALSNWGKQCQAATVVDSTVLGLFDGQVVRIATDLQGTEFKKNEELLKLPQTLKSPRLSQTTEGVVAWSPGSKQAFLIDLKAKTAKPVAPPEVSANPPVPLADLGDWAMGDMDNDGDLDLVHFRYAKEAHSGNNVVIYRQLSPGETDSDRDGLTNDEETKLGTDPHNPDTDGDALLDGWETSTYKDLDMKAMGCDPTKQDVICLISRFEQVDEKFCKDQLTEAQKYYDSIGIKLHLLYLDPMNEEQQKRPWQRNRDELRPAKWKGLVHWMQISPHGGGQADQLGDGGGCGGGGWALYATFVHEFGHQLGLPHEGFYGAAWCPTYPSLMNYAYSYTLEDNIRNVRYSDGRLANFKMKETNLSEIIPLPYEKIKFLEKAPYRYRLQENGDQTLIDWNWNGVFGEEGVKADINYSYSTTAGHRDHVDRLHSAPWLFTHQDKAFALFARHDFPGDVKTDPTVSPEKPGHLIVRTLVKPYEWEKEWVIERDNVTGDPVAISFGNEVFATYQVKDGIVLRRLDPKGKKAGEPMKLSSDPTLVPSLGVVEGRLLLGLYNPATWRTHYRWWDGEQFGKERPFGFLSTVPVSFAEDTLKNRLIVGLAWDQDAQRPSRWQIRRYSLSGDTLFDRGHEWIEGEKGGSRGRSRPVVLFDPDTQWGPDGRVYYFALGMTSKETPWSCAYVAHTIGDKTVNGGWRVKRYYDEWTQSRSGPAAAWFGGDIIYAYRWVNAAQNDNDNLLHVAYRGSGIEDAEMGDFDDISHIKNFGLRYSILYMLE